MLEVPLFNGIDNAGEQEQALPSAEESKMDRTRLLLIGIVALVLSAALSYVVYQRLQAKMAPPKLGVDVVVAAIDIQIGAKIADRDLKVVKYPPPKICLPVSFTQKRPHSGAAQCFLSARGNL